jgi:ribosomal protein S18 acetylase RimI-like enzyme
VVKPPALVNGARYLLAVEKHHPKERLWYLFLLAVDPSVQRSGIGTLLQRDMLEQADREGLDCYLETQKPENVPYYRRFGYEVETELRPVRKGPPLFTMRRRAAGEAGR